MEGAACCWLSTEVIQWSLTGSHGPPWEPMGSESPVGIPTRERGNEEKCLFPLAEVAFSR